MRPHIHCGRTHPDVELSPRLEVEEEHVMIEVAKFGVFQRGRTVYLRIDSGEGELILKVDAITAEGMACLLGAAARAAMVARE